MMGGIDVQRLIRWHMESAQKLRAGAPDRKDFMKLEQQASDYESTAHLLAVLVVRNGNGKANGNGNRSLRPTAQCTSCGTPPNNWPKPALVEAARAMPCETPIESHRCQRCGTMYDILAGQLASAS